MLCSEIAMKNLVLVLMLALAGCYAEFDWREIRPVDAGFTVSLPGRPTYEGRALSGERAGLTMHLWSAKVGNTVFAAGYVDSPVADAQLVDGLRDALVKNIGGRIVSEREVRSGNAAGRETVADGSAGGASVELRLRLYAAGARVYQVVALGRKDAVPAAEMENFFDSFRLARP